jgi:putative hydrolase of the HAD superfamily
MIKAIIFDFGNVICKFDNNLFIQRISNFSDKSVPELNDLIYQRSDLLKQYETGLITSDDFFDQVVKQCSLDISRTEFIKAFTDIFSPVQETFDLIDRLKSRHKLALLSNTSQWDFEYGIKTCGVYDRFDTVSLSFMVKEMKPGEKIYFDALNKLNLEPEECIYIDDIKEYVEAAVNIGMTGIHYISHEKLTESLRRSEIDL